MTHASPQPSHPPQIRVSQAVRRAAIVIACVVLFKLFFGTSTDSITNTLAGSIPFVTALEFLVGAAALWTLHAPFEHRWLRRTIQGGALTLICLSVLLLGWTLTDAGMIDYRSAMSSTLRQPPGLARVTPIATGSFLLLGCAILMVTRRKMRSAHMLAAAIVLLSLQGLISYIYSVVPFATLDAYPQIAPQAALGLLALALGVLLKHPEQSFMRAFTSTRASGVLARNLLLPAIALPIALEWLMRAVEQSRLIEQWVLGPVHVTALIVTFIGLIVRCARVLHRSERQREQAQIALHAAHAELEERVALRTAELSTANSLLQAEIRERQQAEAALRLLAQASAVLAETLDEYMTLQQVAQLTITELADACVIDALNESGQPERIAQAYRTPDVEATFKQSLTQSQGGATLHETDARSGTQHEAGTALMQLVVPLDVRTQPIGTLTLARSPASADYSEAERALAEELGRRIAQAIDNARLYRAAQEAAQMREEFLSIAAHELKTPLSALLGNTFVLERRLAKTLTLPERDIQTVQSISEQGWRLHKLIDALLDLSRIELGRFTIEPQIIDLVALVQRVVAEHPATAQHSLHLQCPYTHLPIRGDEIRLEQVLRNLLQNAIKYSPAGGPIFVRVAEISDGVTIAVTDHGIGIPQAAQAHLFNRFYRARNTDVLRVTGLGIGLYVVKEIVVQHGGSIEIRSTEGRGSTFTVRLPYPERAGDTVEAIAPSADQPVHPKAAQQSP